MRQRSPSRRHTPRLHVRRRLARGRRRRAAGTWPVRRPELLPLEIRDEQGQRAIHDRGGVAVGDGMTEKILRSAELRAGLGAGGEAHLVALGGEGPHDGGSSRRRRYGNRCGGRQREGARRRCHLRRGRGRRGLTPDRKLAHGRRDVGLRRVPGHQLLDLPLAAVRPPRPAPGWRLPPSGAARSTERWSGLGGLPAASPGCADRAPCARRGSGDRPRARRGAGPPCSRRRAKGSPRPDGGRGPRTPRDGSRGRPSFHVRCAPGKPALRSARCS